MSELIVAGGCFWGLEELFRGLEGVTDTQVGYTGGNAANPTYAKHDGHAESIAIWYDDRKLSLETLLDFFFRVHDPTNANRQGNDIGTSYRSALFYHDDKERQRMATFLQDVDASGYWNKPVATTLEPLETFYPAEEYHQDYLQKHPGGYTCRYLRTPWPLTELTARSSRPKSDTV